MKLKLYVLAAVLSWTLSAPAATVSIPASQDATIYEDATGSLANGAGLFLHAGKNGVSGGNRIVRALVQFDVAANVPAGAVITSAVLKVSASKHTGVVSVYRLTSAWSEGPTDASSGEGGGAPAATGDVTWVHTTYDTQFWAAMGGDFVGTARASATIGSVPSVASLTSATLVADVQQMLDLPAVNAGWMIRNDDEATGGNAIQFGSRSNAGQEPVLEVGYGFFTRPTLYYDFEEGGGTVITNKSPTAGGTNGVLSGAAAAWVAGPAGSFTPANALQFDGVFPGSGGVWVDTLYGASGLGAGDYDYTVACWLNFRKTTGDCFIVGQSMNPNFVHLGFRNRNAHLGHYGADLTSSTLLDTGTWYHVAFVFEGGRTTGVQRIYINGVADRVVGDRIKIRDVATNLIVGSSDSASGRSYSGAADDLAIYSVALTESQVGYLAAGGNPMTVPAATSADREFFTAPHGSGGTWNLYERVGARHGAVTSWYGAYVASTSRVSGIAGITSTPHLVTISTNTENEFVRRLLRWDQTNYVQTTIESAWLGLTDDTSGVVQVSNAETGDTNITLVLRRAGFTNWIDGTSVVWTNWAANEPNDSSPGEDGIEIQSAGTWNDQRSGVPGTPQEALSVDNLYIIEWDVQSPAPITSPSVTVNRVQAVLPPTLPGPAGTNDSFGGYWHRASAALGEIRNGVEFLLREGAPGYGTVVTTNSGLPIINHSDPDVAGNLNSGLFPSNLPYFGQVGGGVTDLNYVVVYKGTLRIRAADAGVWTFGVHSDDGFALRVGTNAWQRVSGFGWRDHTDPTVMTFEYGTGDSSTRGAVNLGVGDHALEFVAFNGTGAQYHELYAARGDFTNDTDTTMWLPVGFYATNGFGSPGVLDTGSGQGWTVWHSVPNTFGTIGNTNQAWLAVEPSILGDSNKTTWASINFYDLGSGQNTTAGSIPNSVRFPYDVEQTNNTEIHVAMFMRASLVVPISGTYYLGFQGDDGSWLRVVGQPWSSIAYSYFTNANLYIEGDKLVCNQGGGNTRTIGLINLTAGTYDIESLWWQGTGGAHYEVLGTHADNPIGTPFGGIPVLGTGLAYYSAIGGGLQLVSTSAPPDVYISTFGAGTPPAIVWNGERGSAYAVQSSTNLLGSEWITTQSGISTDRPPLLIRIPLTNESPGMTYRVQRTAP